MTDYKSLYEESYKAQREIGEQIEELKLKLTKVPKNTMNYEKMMNMEKENEKLKAENEELLSFQKEVDQMEAGLGEIDEDYEDMRYDDLPDVIKKLKEENEKLRDNSEEYWKDEAEARQCDYEEKCKEIEGLEEMEAQVTDALWDESTPECRIDLIVAEIRKLRNGTCKEVEEEEEDPFILELETEINELKENLEKKDKQIERLLKNKNNREKQLIHIRAICENTDEYIEEKVSEKMDEYVVKKQNDKIDKLKELLEEAEPFLRDYKGGLYEEDYKQDEKVNDLLIEIENI